MLTLQERKKYWLWVAFWPIGGLFQRLWWDPFFPFLWPYIIMSLALSVVSGWMAGRGMARLGIDWWERRNERHRNR